MNFRTIYLSNFVNYEFSANKDCPYWLIFDQIRLSPLVETGNPLTRASGFSVYTKYFEIFLRNAFNISILLDGLCVEGCNSMISPFGYKNMYTCGVWTETMGNSLLILKGSFEISISIPAISAKNRSDSTGEVSQAGSNIKPSFANSIVNSSCCINNFPFYISLKASFYNILYQIRSKK